MVFQYRADIDGLRAVAVFLVVLFHAGLGFPGGFIGVDVFFVISGYLITGIVLKECRAGLFQLSEFWLRRVRRILPASMFMVFITLILGSYFLAPNEYADLALSAMAQQAMISNVYFWRTMNYFAGPANLKPLLHTWSLSVEEQFYLGYPLLIWFIIRWRNWATALIIGALLIASFTGNVVGVYWYPNPTFYLLPTRAWELLLGGVIWFVGRSDNDADRTHDWLSEILAAVGIISVFSSACFFDSSTRFPGVWALVPCLGTVFVIIANRGRLTLVGKILSLKPVVFVGLISYSLYLWHWPVLVFLRHRFGSELALELRIMAVLASFGLGILSWHWIEKPFRGSATLKSSPKRTIRLAGISFVLVLSLAWTIYSSRGLRFYYTQAYLDLVDDGTWNGYEYLRSLKKTENQDVYLVESAVDSQEKPAIFIWGDSHARACLEAIGRAAESQEIAAKFMSNAGISPFSLTQRGQSKNAVAMKVALESEIKDVVLIGRWSMVEAELDQNEAIDNETMKSPGGKGEKVKLKSFAVVNRLIAAGKKVWVIKQVPEPGQMVATELARSMRFGIPNPLTRVTIEDHQRSQHQVNSVLDQLAGLGAVVIDPSEGLFDDKNCLILALDNRAVYRDYDHLSRVGAEKFMQPIFEKIFETIKKRNNDVK